LARPFQVPWPLRRKGLFTEYFTPSKPGAESWHLWNVSMAFLHRWPALRSTRCLKALLRKLNCISTCPHERHQKNSSDPQSSIEKNQFPQAHFQWRPTWSHQFKVVHLEVKWSKFRGFGTIRQGIGANAGNSEILWTPFKAHVNPFNWSWLPNYWLVLSMESGNGMIVNIL
jgi:hypothetical protein